MSQASTPMQSETQTAAPTTSETRHITGGRVKWFNNKLGYGFISYTNSENVASDIFVHYSQLKDTSGESGNAGTGFKTLFQGEYVDFNIIPCSNSEHEIQASEVTGVNGGPLFAVSSGWSGGANRRNNEENYTGNPKGGRGGRGGGGGKGRGGRGGGRGSGNPTSGSGDGPDMDV